MGKGRHFSTLTNLGWASSLALAISAFACSGGHGAKETVPSAAIARQALSAPDEAALASIVKYSYRDVCDHPDRPHAARCFAKVRTDASGQAAAFDTPQGFGPVDLASAYDIPATGTLPATIAIVDAYDNPEAEADLGFYRDTFGLPACTSDNGCFEKVNQAGRASPLPQASTVWAGEIALDIELASAICPSCSILLVEADDPQMENLGAAVKMAVALGATVVSNSYGGEEDDTVAGADATYFDAPSASGVAIFAASGDMGYESGTQYPASGANVIGVGGTSLVRSASPRGWAEAVWGGPESTNGTGGGCSIYIDRPPWATETDSPHCGKKTVADVSAVADPHTGVAVYNTYVAKNEKRGWLVYGGTSAATPIVATIFATTGNGAANGSLIWNHHDAFHDVTTGTNYNGAPPAGGAPCAIGDNNLCNGVVGFDAPTGVGTPSGSALMALAGDGGLPEPGAPDASPDASPNTDNDASTAPAAFDASTTSAPSPDSGAAAVSQGTSGTTTSCAVARSERGPVPEILTALGLSALLALRRRRKTRPN